MCECTLYQKTKLFFAPLQKEMPYLAYHSSNSCWNNYSGSKPPAFMEEWNVLEVVNTTGAQPCKARGEFLGAQCSQDRTGNQWSFQCTGWGEASGTPRLSVTIIHLELHGAQTHCHRKRLSETSECLQQQRHGQRKKTGEWEREKKVGMQTHTPIIHTPTNIQTFTSID